MRRIFYIGLMVGFCSCGHMIYSYKFSMKESEKPYKLYYKNDTLSISSNFYFEGLMVEVTNKSDEPVKINWDELTMTENETNKKIEHVVINEGGIIVYQPPSIISPKSGYADLVVYADNIYYLKEDGEEKMKIKDMYPRESRKRERDSVQQLKGQRITLLLPIEIKSVSHLRVFNFLLEEIKSRREFSAGGTILTLISL